MGAIGGLVCFWACMYLKIKCGYDDSLDVFGVHGMGGTTGAILTGVFASKAVNPAGADGLLNGNAGQLLNQVMAVLITWVFAGGLTFIFAKVTEMLVGLRVNSEEEREGLDQSQHGETGYILDERSF